MLTDKQLSDIREHLNRAQNPLFYYDNDADGLCSFLLLSKFIERGKGVAIRSFPDLNGGYAKKAKELNADYIFILDKPVISKEFFEEINSIGLTIVWIDHHDIVPAEFEKEFENLHIYNPARNKGKEKSEEPVTYWCYQISKRKEDIWIAVIGCISDHYLPDFVSDFKEIYGEYWGEVDKPFDAYYNTEIGKIAQALNFGLKDSITNVINLQKFLISCKNPGEVLSESKSNYNFRKKHKETEKKYDVLMTRAKKIVKEKSIFFEYSGDLSMSSDISNELSYRYPKKYVAVAYKKGNIANLSLRGKNVKRILEKILESVKGGGGGHEDAVGATVKTEDLKKFKEVFEKVVEEV